MKKMLSIIASYSCIHALSVYSRKKVVAVKKTVLIIIGLTQQTILTKGTL